MGNCNDKRLPCLTISACDVVFERAWEGMESGGERRESVVEEAVEEESPESCRERRWPAPDAFSCEGGFDAVWSGRSKASAP